MTGDPSKRVRVDLANRAYEVRIGTDLVDRAAELIVEALGPAPLVVIADAALEATPHLARLHRALEVAGIDAPVFDVPSGEASKSLATYGRLLDEVLALRPDRSTVVVAMGGGVVGDLAGFVAATLLRGVRLVQIPTTLLAQVDSSVGGKTGINSPRGKNLIGAFHQPSLVLADLSTLASLPARERRAGYAEVVKYGLLGDAPFFAWLEANGERALAGDPEALAHIVETAVRAKAEIVVADEEERGDRRALLNLGHTFAHAYERLTGFGERLLHGEAVALGMIRAFELSVRLGLCPESDLARVRRHLDAVGLPVEARAIGTFPAEAMVEAMRGDKKARGGQLVFVLVRGIGEAFVARGIDEAAVVELLRDVS